MAEKSGQEKNDALSDVLDLSDLQGLSIGPNWSDPAFKEKKPRVEDYPDGGRSGRKGGGPRRDRRPAGMGKDRPRRDFGGKPSGRDEREGGHRERDSRGGPHSRAPFTPSIEATFYAEDAPFRALAQAMRQTNRTYELFEVAQAILQKPERFVVVVKSKNEGGRQKEGADESGGRQFWVSVPDGLPFESEEEATNHVFAHHLDTFFDAEEVEVEAPKGAFQVITKCGVTGELLGPPNFHRYQELLREHHAQRISRMSFEEFQRRLETVRDEEAVNTWLEKMTKQQRYICKEAAGDGEKQAFESAESAKHFLLRLHKDKVVTHSPSARFTGTAITQLPQNSHIRRSVDYLLEGQRRFPLDTANHLRGRLRRLNFTVYKRGSKGVSYVCAVKRKFRSHGQVFSDSVQKIIEFIEKNPEVKVADIPEKLYGIVIPERKDAPATETAEAQPATENAEAPAAQPAPEAAHALSPEQAQQIAEFKQNLHWLVSEGYVVEYGNGTLFAPEPRPEPKPKEAKPAATTDAAEAKPETATPAAEETPTAESAPEPKPEEEAPAAEETPAAEAQVPAAESAAQEAAPEPKPEEAAAPEETPAPEAVAEAPADEEKAPEPAAETPTEETAGQKKPSDA